MKHSPEHHILQVKVVLYNACCGHSDPQNILLRWQIRSSGNAVQVIQIARRVRKTNITYVPSTSL